MTLKSPEAIGFLVVDLARLFRQNFDRAVAEEGLGITAGEARTLLYAADWEGMRQNALAERMRVEPMTLCNFLDRLERGGLIARDPDPSDRRAKIVRVTEAAQPLLDRIRAIATEIRARATVGLQAEEVEALRNALRTMRGNLGTAIGERPE
jgi:MarR family transcriptional regulator for hemolysin